jgi:hypothetical protein
MAPPGDDGHRDAGGHRGQPRSHSRVTREHDARFPPPTPPCLGQLITITGASSRSWRSSTPDSSESRVSDLSRTTTASPSTWSPRASEPSVPRTTVSPGLLPAVGIARSGGPLTGAVQSTQTRLRVPGEARRQRPDQSDSALRAQPPSTALPVLATCRAADPAAKARDRGICSIGAIGIPHKWAPEASGCVRRASW